MAASRAASRPRGLWSRRDAAMPGFRGPRLEADAGPAASGAQVFGDIPSNGADRLAGGQQHDRWV